MGLLMKHFMGEFLMVEFTNSTFNPISKSHLIRSAGKCKVSGQEVLNRKPYIITPRNRDALVPEAQWDQPRSRNRDAFFVPERICSGQAVRQRSRAGSQWAKGREVRQTCPFVTRRNAHEKYKRFRFSNRKGYAYECEM